MQIELILKVVGGVATASGLFVGGRKLFTSLESFISVVKRTYMLVLKLTANHADTPIEERLDAADEYESLGGNGAQKIKNDKLREDYRKGVL